MRDNKRRHAQGCGTISDGTRQHSNPQLAGPVLPEPNSGAAWHLPVAAVAAAAIAAPVVVITAAAVVVPGSGG
jgi:hypothetical protein